MNVKADKGKSIVNLPMQQYDTKIQNFICKNHFQTINTTSNKKSQNQIRKTANRSKTLIPQDPKCKHMNLYPSVPTIKGLIKIHKHNQPTALV